MPGLKETSKPSLRKASLKPSENPTSKPSLSNEFVYDSDDDDETEGSSSAGQQSPTPASTRPASGLPIQARSSSVTAPKPASSIAKLSKKKRSESPTSSDTNLSASQGSEDRRSHSERESDSEVESDKERSRNFQERSRPVKAQHTASAQVPPPYQIPPGFEKVSISSESSTLTALFSSSELQGKQIWHITVPGSVPLDSIKEVSLQDVIKGTPILSHKGADYGLVAEETGENAKEALLLPFPKSNEYRSASSAVTTTLHLQQLVRLPSLSHRSAGLPNDAADTLNTRKKPVRRQPENLKMRYRPFGDSPTPPPEDSIERLKFRAPFPLNTEGRPKKRKHDKAEGEGRDSLETPRKFKKRKPRSEFDAGNDVIEFDGNSSKETPKQVEPSNGKAKEHTKDVESATSAEHDNEVRESIMKRRKDKKRHETSNDVKGVAQGIDYNDSKDLRVINTKGKSKNQQRGRLTSSPEIYSRARPEPLIETKDPELKVKSSVEDEAVAVPSLKEKNAKETGKEPREETKEEKAKRKAEKVKRKEEKRLRKQL